MVGQVTLRVDKVDRKKGHSFTMDSELMRDPVRLGFNVIEVGARMILIMDKDGAHSRTNIIKKVSIINNRKLRVETMSGTVYWMRTVGCHVTDIKKSLNSNDYWNIGEEES